MTPEREREIRSACERSEFDRHERGDSPGEMMRDLLAEVDRLRRLPVIATCGQCGYESLSSDADGYDASVCTKSGPRQWLLVRADKEPPDWCPLRGAR